MAWLLLHLSTFPYTRIDFNTQSTDLCTAMSSCSKPFLFGVINWTHLFFTALWCKYSTATFLFYKVSISESLAPIVL